MRGWSPPSHKEPSSVDTRVLRLLALSASLAPLLVLAQDRKPVTHEDSG